MSVYHFDKLYLCGSWKDIEDDCILQIISMSFSDKKAFKYFSFVQLYDTPPVLWSPLDYNGHGLNKLNSTLQGSFYISIVHGLLKSFSYDPTLIA